MRLITEQSGGSRLGDFLKSGLSSDASSFRGAAAWIRASAMSHLQPLVRDFSRTRSFELIVGIDLKGTSVEGLQMLLDALGERGRAFVFHNAAQPTFHPKLYRFAYSERHEIYVGSGNLTAGGLFTNHEAGIELTIDEHTPGGRELLRQVDETLDRFSVSAGRAALELNADLIADLTDRGLIVTEAAARAATAKSSTPKVAQGGGTKEPLFGSIAVAPPPTPLVTLPRSGASTKSAEGKRTRKGETRPEPELGESGAIPRPRYFVMTLQKTDVGSGQTTAGTIRRSPEVFIPLAARDLQPEFWGWPHEFVEDPKRPGKMDRPGVPFMVEGQPVDIHIWYNPVKRDIRLRNEVLRSAGEIGDLLLLERRGVSGVEYVASIIPQGTTEHRELSANCNQPVRNSLKSFGYF